MRNLHHLLEEAQRANNSRTGSPRICTKQTINAGDNPCPSFQSPLPYMLAGLAAMVLLVVISLMILACSYLRGYFSNAASPGSSSSSQTPPADHGGSHADLNNPKASALQASQHGFGASPEKMVVILAGQDKPTHLAQPIQVSLTPTDDDHHHHAPKLLAEIPQQLLQGHS